MLNFTGMLKSTVGDRPQQLRLQKQISKSTRMDWHIHSFDFLSFSSSGSSICLRGLIFFFFVIQKFRFNVSHFEVSAEKKSFQNCCLQVFKNGKLPFWCTKPIFFKTSKNCISSIYWLWALWLSNLRASISMLVTCEMILPIRSNIAETTLDCRTIIEFEFHAFSKRHSVINFSLPSAYSLFFDSIIWQHKYNSIL